MFDCSPQQSVIQKDIAVARKDIAYIKFLLEGYEGLAMATTINKTRAVLRLFIMPDFIEDVTVILESLKQEIVLQEIISERRYDETI